MWDPLWNLRGEGVEEKAWEKEVAGEYNTFLVYLYLLKSKHASSREIQRALNFSSPSLASHHLDKLKKLGLVTEDSWGNCVVVPRSFGILRFFFIAGSWIVPRSIFLAAIFATMTVGFMLYSLADARFLPFLALSSIGLIYTVYQTAMFFRVLPEKR
jgi:DNA-binding transcriptional ArsR family regulator